MSLSPACLVNGSAPPVDVAAGATFTVALANTSGVRFWGLACVGTDELGNSGAVGATISINQTNFTATVTAPAGLGSAVVLQSTVGVASSSSQGTGIDANGNVQPTWTTTFKVNVPTALGLRVFAFGETLEQGPAGWVNPVNAAIRAVPSGGGGGSTSDGQFSVTLANGLNSNVAMTSGVVQTVGGPSAAFSVGGFSYAPAQTRSQRQTLVNKTAFPMTVVHEDGGSSPANRISVGSGRSVVVAPFGSVSLAYDGNASRWVVQNLGLARPRHFDVTDFGAKGDGMHVGTASMVHNTNVVQQSIYDFTKTAAIGQLAVLYTPGFLGTPTVYAGTITGVTDAQHVTVNWTLPLGAASIVGNGIFTWGTDDTTAIANAIAAATAAILVNNSYTTAPEVYFPPGTYCVSSGFALGGSHIGLKMSGASQAPEQPQTTTQSMIRAMASMPYVVHQEATTTRFENIWICGNRLAINTFEAFATLGPPADSTTQSTFDRVRFDGGVNSTIHFTGNSEVDNMAFRSCYAYGDSYDSSYFATYVILDDNAQSFQWNWYEGAIIGGEYLIYCSHGSSINFFGTQTFNWGIAAFRFETAVSNCILENLYNERDFNFYLRVDATAGVTAIGSLTLRYCNIQACPLYTAHTSEIWIQGGVYGGNIHSDPLAASFTDASGVSVYGNQMLVIERAVLANGNAVIYDSGVPGQLVQLVGVTYQTAQVTYSTGAVSGSTLSFTSSPPTLTASLTGMPVMIDNAGAGGSVPYKGFIKKVLSASSATLSSPVNTNIPIGATVHLGNEGWLNGLGEQFLQADFIRSPGELVLDSAQLSQMPQPPAWTPATQYSGGISYVVPTPSNGLYYQCSATLGTGTSGGGQPAFPTTVGATVVDNPGANQVTWTCWGPLPARSYDADGLVLGVAAAPSQSGVVVAADWHYISGLTANRTYETSTFAASSGAPMKITNATAFVVTVNANGALLAVLAPNQWVELKTEPSIGWVVWQTNSREKKSTTLQNSGVTIGSGGQGIVATVKMTPTVSGDVQVVGSLGPGSSIVWGGVGDLQLYYAPSSPGGLGTALMCGHGASTIGSPTAWAQSAAGIAPGLTLGTSYDFYLVMSPSGSSYTPGASCKVGLSVREIF